jgi:hypothetical protein
VKYFTCVILHFCSNLIEAAVGGVWYIKANSIAMFASSSGGTVGGGEVGVVSQSIIPDLKSSINDTPPSNYSTSVTPG